MPDVSLNTYLFELERLLNQHGLWSELSPHPDALQSSAPFACDTLAFEQWLQFIFIPKMRLLLEGGDALPTKMHLAPMAEQVWGTMPRYKKIIEMLALMDAFINDKN